MYYILYKQVFVIVKDGYKWKKLLKTLSCSPPSHDAYVTGLSN